MCLTLQDYFNTKQSRDLLDRVFITNSNWGYIDHDLINAELLAFEKNEVVDRLDQDVAEQDDLMPYKMFMVREGQERAYFKRGGGAVFGPFINHALLMMVANSMGDNGVITAIRCNNLVVMKMVIAVFEFIVRDIDGILRPGCLGVLERLFGMDLPRLTIAIQRAASCWGDMYPQVNPLVREVLGHIRLLGVLVADGGNWAGATCSMCWELMTELPCGVTTCGHMFHMTCW